MAVVDLVEPARDYRIVVEGKTQEVHLMMAGAEFLLVRDDRRMVRVIPRSRVSEIRILDVHAPYPWVSRKFFLNVFGWDAEPQNFKGR